MGTACQENAGLLLRSWRGRLIWPAAPVRFVHQLCCYWLLAEVKWAGWKQKNWIGSWEKPFLWGTTANLPPFHTANWNLFIKETLLLNWFLFWLAECSIYGGEILIAAPGRLNWDKLSSRAQEEHSGPRIIEAGRSQRGKPLRCCCS